MSDKVTHASSAELFQGTGNLIQAFFDSDLFVRELIKPMIDASSLLHQSKETVVFDNGACEKTDVFGLFFGDATLGFTTLIATNNGTKTNEVLAVFPVSAGLTHKVRIEEVMVWENQICATVRCSIDGFGFAFFASDFYLNKEKYLENEFLEIDLVELACNAEKGLEGFSFEGQDAVNWLAKMGQEASYNEDGSVQPVQFSMAEFVAYLALEAQTPNEAQFQSPVGPVENFSFVGIDLYKTSVIIRGEDAEFKVPVILRKEFVPSLKEGMPIRGYSCMIGKIAD